jgi:hypothetical protein
MNEADIEEITALVQDVVDGGLPGIRAKDSLREAGYKARTGLANALRELDYFDSDDSTTAFEINRLLRGMTGDRIPVPFAPVEIGADVPLEKAHINAVAVKSWLYNAKKYNSAEAWKEFLAGGDKGNDGDK